MEDVLRPWRIPPAESEKSNSAAYRFGQLPLTCGATLSWVLLLYWALQSQNPKHRDWLIFISLIFPWPLMLYLPKRFEIKAIQLNRVGSLIFGLLPLAIAIQISSLLAFLVGTSLCLLQYGLEGIFSAGFQKYRRFELPEFSEFSLVLAVWIFLGKLWYWNESGFSGVLFSRWWAVFPVMVGLGLTVFFVLAGTERAVERDRRNRGYLLLLLGLIIPLVFAGLNSGKSDFPAHWGFYCGPAELVRQGGWLLNTVPSQYGLLNIFLVAHGPFSSVYANLLILQACLYIVVAAVFYRALSSFLKGGGARLFALISVLLLLFYLPGWAPTLSNAINYPSVGPFRFFGAYLLPFLVWQLTGQLKDQGKLRSSSLILGNLIWLISVFWSAETMIYGSVAWWPAYLVSLRLSDGQKVNHRYFWFWVLAPFAVLLFLLSFVAGWYQLQLHQWPDWYAYLEYPLAYAGGFSSMATKGDSAVWVPILLGGALCFRFIEVVVKQAWRSLPLALSTTLAFWAVNSYFASRSHDNNILNLLPIYFFLILLSFSEAEEENGRSFSSRRFLVPLLTLSLLLPTLHPGFLSSYLERVQKLRSTWQDPSLLSQLPEPPAEVTALIKAAGLTPQTPIASLADPLFFWPSAESIENPTFRNFSRLPPFFLPFAPFEEFRILGVRTQTYLDRWFSQNHRRAFGYLLFLKRERSASLEEYLAKWYQAGPVECRSQWCLERFDPNAID